MGKKKKEKYQITLNEDHVKILIWALDLYSRIPMGQWREILRLLPLKSDINYDEYHEDVSVIGKMLSRYLIDDVDGWNSSLGITQDSVSLETKISYEMLQVLRHQISWDRAIKSGYVSDYNDNRTKEMIGVNYDDPFFITKEKKIKISKNQ